MSWHYQVRRRKCCDDYTYDIVEAYTNPKGHTEGGVKPVGDTRKELIQCLELMLKDAKRYRTITDKEA